MPIKRYINYKLMDLKKSKKRRNSSGGLGFRFNDADFLSIYSEVEDFEEINIPYGKLELSEENKNLLVNAVINHVIKEIKESINQ